MDGKVSALKSGSEASMTLIDIAEEFVGAGKVLRVGVSNFNINQIQEVNASLPKS